MIQCTGRRSHDYGVSESIGFLLIFGMVIVGIGLVTLYGYPMLIQQQTSADRQIMQKNMIVLQNDMKSLAYKTVPYKETSLNIGGGELTVYNASYTPAIGSGASFEIYRSGTGPYVIFYPGSLRWSSLNAGTDISLMNGAVVTRDYVVTGSTMLAQPRWFYDDLTNTMVVNLISLNSSYTMARTGVGTVQMTMKRTNFTTNTIPAGSSVCVKYVPETGQDYRTAWFNYFEDTLKMSTGGGCGADYRLPITSGTLVIKEYDIEVLSL